MQLIGCSVTNPVSCTTGINLSRAEKPGKVSRKKFYLSEKVDLRHFFGEVILYLNWKNELSGGNTFNESFHLCTFVMCVHSLKHTTT